MENVNDLSEDEQFGITGLSQRGPQGTRIPAHPSSYVLTPKLMSKTTTKPDANSIETNRTELVRPLGTILSPRVNFEKQSYIKPLVGDLSISKTKPKLTMLDFGLDDEPQTQRPLQRDLTNSVRHPSLNAITQSQVIARIDGSLPRNAYIQKENNFGGLKHFSDYITSYKSNKKQKDKLENRIMANPDEVVQFTLAQYRENKITEQKQKIKKAVVPILKKNGTYSPNKRTFVKASNYSATKKKVIFSSQLTVFLFYKSDKKQESQPRI